MICWEPLEPCPVTVDDDIHNEMWEVASQLVFDATGKRWSGCKKTFTVCVNCGCGTCVHCRRGIKYGCVESIVKVTDSNNLDITSMFALVDGWIRGPIEDGMTFEIIQCQPPAPLLLAAAYIRDQLVLLCNGLPCDMPAEDVTAYSSPDGTSYNLFRKGTLAFGLPKVQSLLEPYLSVKKARLYNPTEAYRFI